MLIVNEYDNILAFGILGSSVSTRRAIWIFKLNYIKCIIDMFISSYFEIVLRSMLYFYWIFS